MFLLDLLENKNGIINLNSLESWRQNNTSQYADHLQYTGQQNM